MNKLGKMAFVLFVMLANGMAIHARQAESASVDTLVGGTPAISFETEQLFNSLVPRHDSTFTLKAVQKDSFGKRFSLHFNLLDWATTVPSLGVEFDLNKTQKNNRSILLFGKYKPSMTHSQMPQVVFDVTSARVEFRKYWRTGGIGRGRVNHEYEKIRLSRPTLRHRTEYLVDQFDTIPTTVDYYATHEDSLLAERYNGDPNRSWFYNRYMQFRRNVTSSRTLRTPRNWRAYYLGAYAGADKWDICFNKKGKSGKGVSLGMTLGWTIPVLTRRFPNEGGLDFDLGLLVGAKAVKYDAYRFGYDADNKAVHIPQPDESKTSWTLVKYPVIHEARIALVYRFRSISKKVSLSLVDDYETKWVEPYESGRAQAERERTDAISDRNTLALQQKREAAAAADSTTFWNNWHERRLSHALLLNPDTVFTGADKVLYQKLIVSKMPQKKGGADDKKRASKKKSKSKQETNVAVAKESATNVDVMTDSPAATAAKKRERRTSK